MKNTETEKPFVYADSGAKLSAVFLDIVEIPIRKEDSLEKVFKRFYAVMRKHGIKQGTKTEHGVVRNNRDWAGAEAILTQHIQDEVQLLRLTQNVPLSLRS